MSCSIGSALNHKCSDEPPEDFRQAGSYADRQLLIIKLRCDMNTGITSVCKRHHKMFWACYVPKLCCDPLNLHQGVNNRRRGTFTISAEFHDVYHELCPRIVQGRKMCVGCKIQVSKVVDTGRARTRSFNRDQKVAILDRLAAGETVAELAKEFGTLESSLQNILKQEHQIRMEVAQVAELLTMDRELRHRVNVGSAFKMEFDEPNNIYVQEHKAAFKQMQQNERLEVVNQIDLHLAAIEEAGAFFREHDRLERGKAIAKRLTRVSNLAREIRKEYEGPKKRGRKKKAATVFGVKSEDNHSEIVKEYEVEVKVDVKEEPVELEEELK